MTEERKTMDLEGLPAPALGVEERSDEAPSAGAIAAPDPEVVAKPKRRQFTAEYRLRVLEEADHCSGTGEVGQLLRREGLYSSHLANWRNARDEGVLRGLRSKKRGVKPKASNPLEPKVRELEAKVARLEKDLHKAHIILDVQEKVAGLLGFSLEDGKDC
jgi:transposase